jgi:V8-like Glu-specific endopeptidase
MSAFGWGMRPLSAGIALGAAIAWFAAGAGATQTALAAAVVPAKAQNAVEFWTADRMMRAKPLDVQVAEQPAIAPRARPAGLEGGTPHVHPPLWPSGAATVSSKSETVPDSTAPMSRQHGVVFLVTPFGLGRCSGTSVNAPNFSVVVTAAHCIHTGGRRGRWIDFRWVFVPGYRYGQRPFGVFPAKWIDTTRRWRMNGSENYDVGAAVVSRNAAGDLLAKAVGGAGIAWNLDAKQVFDIHGYSAEPPFDGETQSVCADTPFLGHDARSILSPGPRNLAAECDVTGGASGGGWTIGNGILNSVTSYGYADDPTTDFGPYFGKEVGRLFRRAGKVG